MAELAPQERLQPSLLDRLTDEEADREQESRDKRVLSFQRLRESVLRDLSWLLNTGNLTQTTDLTNYPHVATSVLNYGMPELAGHIPSSTDVVRIEREVRQAIWNFEPRILRNTVKVRFSHNPEDMTHNALTFEIEGELWSQPIPEQLFLRTEIDLESGGVRIKTSQDFR